jgi:hypothetical protein
MQETLQQLIPYAGLGLLGAWILSYNPKVTEYATKAKDYLGSMVTKKPKVKTIPIDEIVDVVEALEALSVHELLDELLSRAEEEKDDEGRMLLGAYGKHVYDLRLAPPKTVSKTKKGG